MKLRRMCAALFVVSSALAWTACSSDEASAPPASDAGADAVVQDPCDTFTTSGAPCVQVSSRVCFPLCQTGGCRCQANPQGDGGIWVCVTDTSCFPDGAPSGNFEDASNHD